MTKNAFSILRNLGLAVPRVYRQEELKNIPSQSKVFIRYCEGLKERNRVVHGDYVKEKYEEIISEIFHGHIVQIAEAVESIAGGAIYIANGYVYCEGVYGEPIGLLRKGMCGIRILCRDNGLVECETHQPFAYKYVDEKLVRVGDCVFDRSRFGVIEEYLVRLQLHEIDSVLLEFSVTKMGVVFCDAKEIKLSFDEKGIKDVFDYSNSHVAVKGKPHLAEGHNDEYLDIDKNIVKLQSLLLENGALLSHYITYNHDKIRNLIIKNKKDDKL